MFYYKEKGTDKFSVSLLEKRKEIIAEKDPSKYLILSKQEFELYKKLNKEQKNTFSQLSEQSKAILAAISNLPNDNFIERFTNERINNIACFNLRNSSKPYYAVSCTCEELDIEGQYCTYEELENLYIDAANADYLYDIVSFDISDIDDIYQLSVDYRIKINNKRK